MFAAFSIASAGILQACNSSICDRSVSVKNALGFTNGASYLFAMTKIWFAVFICKVDVARLYPHISKEEG